MSEMDGFDRKSVDLSAGTIRYREAGEGPPIVFVHGFLVNGLLWRKPATRLAAQARCIVPDWPLGSHEVPMGPDADLSPPGLAGTIAELLEALEIEDVTLVGNDSGGALSQIVVANHRERVGRLVLTNCDLLDKFPPGAFKPLVYAARVPGGLTAFVQPLRWRWGQRLPIAFGLLSMQPVDQAVMDSWVRPFFASREIRRDTRKVAAGFDPTHTLEAAGRLAGWDRPVLFAWGQEDRFFKLADAQRLAARIPESRLEPIPGARTFVAEDQPERLAELIGEVLPATSGQRAGAG